ncbi:helix-turn-helix domain-containing protein [Leucobacter japonicus]|uniref:helix-turn-helix domain-containing protein n=1 Tax=Leucobacter japonicus TaxID=1461259 RepID=UPI0006A7CBED|nr:helix-turn-helix domain-containing protein [Leucobacter japonicus]
MSLPDSDAWWPVALQCLEADLPRLVDDFLGRLRDLRGGYAAVNGADLRQTAHDTLSYLIAQLAERPVPQSLHDLPQRLGVRRARQGVDRDQLLEAVRLDYRVLWAGLVSIAGDTHAEDLVQHAELVLTSVEDYIHAVQVAFLDERESLASDTRTQETRAFAMLLASDEPRSIAAEVAAQLRFPESAEFEIALIPTPWAPEARRAAAVSERSRQRLFAWDFDDSVLFVRPCSSGEHPLARIGGVQIAPVDGLAAVPSAVDFAHQLLPFAAAGRLSDENDLWLALAADTAASTMPRVFTSARVAMDRVRADERQRLLDTFSRYCATGSIKRTAEAMFVHRNTVVNRLQMFHRVTGWDPTVPLDAARALLAFGQSARTDNRRSRRLRGAVQDRAS